ncbi:hypothetical protein CPB97_005632 [Podila verticillata]|nr:hypothetical protein CPB97_005632 [Podila verticillata]
MTATDLKVLIVGGGIAGLTLATLLEKADIDFQVYERAAVVRPLGSVVAIGPNVLALIEQIGLLDKFAAAAKVTGFVTNFNEQRQQTSYFDYRELKERNGYPNYTIARSRLYDLLYSQIPSEKVHMNKRLSSYEQDDHGVTLTFTDGTTAQGDIVVGADGAYSQVRQSLYDRLSKEGTLPESDKEELPCSSICLVGQTTGPLDANKFVHLDQEDCRFESVSGDDKPFTWLTWTLPEKRMSWMMIEHLNDHVDRKTLPNIEWGPGAAEAMIARVREFPIPSGDALTMGDLIDVTPRELISQVALEGKFFETWFSGRTVLIGDACHKLVPSTAQGANVSMQDAIILSNYLYALKDKTPESLSSAFKGYFEEREPFARAAFETSDRFRKFFRMRRLYFVIRLIVAHLPQWVWRRAFDKMYGYRPQVTFLPRVPDRGSVKAFPQKSI